jgi:hypothetical protein
MAVVSLGVSFQQGMVGAAVELRKGMVRGAQELSSGIRTGMMGAAGIIGSVWVLTKGIDRVGR